MPSSLFQSLVCWRANRRIRETVNGYKFERMRRASAALGDLLLEKIDQLPSGTIVVPIPTVSAHIRQRGYDHSKLIAKYIARKRGLKYNQALERVTATKQRGASKAVREKQARKAFAVRGSITPDVPYLLIDDVVTTGATMRYAAQALLDGGASHVWAAAIARQPLD